MSRCNSFQRLTAPHSGSRVSVEFQVDKILVSYIGTPDALLAAGAIEAPMAVAGRRGAQGRCDSKGNYFVRIKRPNGEISVRRHFRNGADAAGLPGVNAADCISCEAGKRQERVRLEAAFDTPEIRRSMMRLIVNNDAGESANG